MGDLTDCVADFHVKCVRIIWELDLGFTCVGYFTME